AENVVVGRIDRVVDSQPLGGIDRAELPGGGAVEVVWRAVSGGPAGTVELGGGCCGEADSVGVGPGLDGHRRVVGRAEQDGETCDEDAHHDEGDQEFLGQVVGFVAAVPGGGVAVHLEGANLLGRRMGTHACTSAPIVAAPAA